MKSRWKMINWTGIIANIISIILQLVIFYVPNHPFSDEVKLMLTIFDMTIYILLVMSDYGYEFQILILMFRKCLIYKNSEVLRSFIESSMLYFGYFGIIKGI